MVARAVSLVFGLALGVAYPAQADAADQSAPAVSNSNNSVRRDPAGRTGISPTWEAIKRGDDAYVAHNIDAAIHEYQAAVEARPQHPVAHYRLGCAFIAKGDLKQAQESLDAALRFSKSDPQTAAKTLFVIADLKERQQDYPAAIAAWKTYSDFAASHKDIKTYAGSADSRKEKLTAFLKLLEQSTQVKQRITERLQMTEAQASQNAKDSKEEDAKASKKQDAKSKNK
jgi:tetratricopeptide (TPR) repeat protein